MTSSPGLAAGDLLVARIALGVTDHPALGLAERPANRFRTIEFRFEKPEVGNGRGFRHAIALADQDAGAFGEAMRELVEKAELHRF